MYLRVCADVTIIVTDYCYHRQLIAAPGGDEIFNYHKAFTRSLTLITSLNLLSLIKS